MADVLPFRIATSPMSAFRLLTFPKRPRCSPQAGVSDAARRFMQLEAVDSGGVDYVVRIVDRLLARRGDRAAQGRVVAYEAETARLTAAVRGY